jgi:uncharacterized membrane protein YhaH (DUF805 family)
MLGFLFGFNARLGRLNYFLSTIALACVMTAICFAIASQVYQSSPKILQESTVMMTWPVIAAGLVFLVATFTLQSMRIRDIGWDPVCVIPAWIAIIIVDKVVAGKIPALSLDGDHNGTAVGALINLGLFLALTFWPSGNYDGPTPDYGEKPDRSYRRPAGSILEDRLSRATGGGSDGRRY